MSHTKSEFAHRHRVLADTVERVRQGLPRWPLTTRLPEPAIWPLTLLPDSDVIYLCRNRDIRKALGKIDNGKLVMELKNRFAMIRRNKRFWEMSKPATDKRPRLRGRVLGGS